MPDAPSRALDPAQEPSACDDLGMSSLAHASRVAQAQEADVRSALIFFSGLAATTAGLVLRACNTGIAGDIANYWCGPQPHALVVQSHAHCAGCGIAAAGFALMIAAIIVASLPRRRVARERA